MLSLYTVEELFDGDRDDVEEGVDTATPDHQKQKIKKPEKQNCFTVMTNFIKFAKVIYHVSIIYFN